MDYQIQAASCFAEGRKIGQFYDGTLSIESGDEPNFGDTGGIVVYSDGVIQSMLSMSVFQPIQGLDFDFESAILTKTNINMTMGPINGKLYEIRMRPLKMETKTTIKDGKNEGSYSFGGLSKPQRV